jgi:hypothetical protein
MSETTGYVPCVKELSQMTVGEEQAKAPNAA